VANRDGRVEPGLYAVGWAKRGPVGVIGTNKADGDQVAQQIAEDVTGGTRPGGAGLREILAQRGVRPVTFADWLRIEAAEVAAAPPGAPRRKLIRIKDMLAIVAQPEEMATEL
jgi:ferredoxin--NADP+ reductase